MLNQKIEKSHTLAKTFLFLMFLFGSSYCAGYYGGLAIGMEWSWIIFILALCIEIIIFSVINMRWLENHE